MEHSDANSKNSHFSYKELLVELEGFEPSTSSMPWKRASQLRHSPIRLDYKQKIIPLKPKK